MVTWSEGRIARAIARQTLASKCVVLVDRCNWTGHECDVLGVTQDLRLIDVEIKISRADLKADARKDKWWSRRGSWRSGERQPEAAHRDWPPKVWKHYYAAPADIWKPELLPLLASSASGVLLVREQRGTDVLSVECVRRATPNRDAKAISAAAAVDIARLANLRMWDAYKQLEQGAARQSIQEIA